MLVSGSVCGKCFTMCRTSKKDPQHAAVIYILTLSRYIKVSCTFIRAAQKQLRIYNNEHQSTKNIHIYTQYTHILTHTVYQYMDMNQCKYQVYVSMFSSHISLCQTGRSTTCSLLASSLSTQSISNISPTISCQETEESHPSPNVPRYDVLRWPARPALMTRWVVYLMRMFDGWMLRLNSSSLGREETCYENMDLHVTPYLST